MKLNWDVIFEITIGILIAEALLSMFRPHDT